MFNKLSRIKWGSTFAQRISLPERFERLNVESLHLHRDPPLMRYQIPKTLKGCQVVLIDRC